MNQFEFTLELFYLSSRTSKVREFTQSYPASHYLTVSNPILAKTINVTGPDSASMEGSEEILELANGCLCCSIKDTGVAAIENLMKRKGAFDYILLETTGLADPGVSISDLLLNIATYSLSQHQ